MMNESEFRLWLETNGYKIYNEHLGANKWYACKRTDIEAPWCFSNEKPIQFVVKYFDFMQYNTNYHNSAQIEICAADKDNQWYELNAYSIAVDEFVEKHDALKLKLIAAWTALNS